MYVCVCQAVTDSEIYQAARKGAKSLRDLRCQLQVGVECGQCVNHARQCLKSAKKDLPDGRQEAVALPGALLDNRQTPAYA